MPCTFSVYSVRGVPLSLRVIVPIEGGCACQEVRSLICWRAFFRLRLRTHADAGGKPPYYRDYR